MPIKQTILKKLIEKSRLISRPNLEAAEITSRHLGCSIADVLVGRNFIKEEDLGKILAKYFRVKFVNLDKIHISASVLNILSESFATKNGVVLFAEKDNQYSLAMEDPKDLGLIELVKKTIGTGAKITPFVATNRAIKESLRAYQKTKIKEDEEIPDNKPKTISAIATIEELLENAVKEDASDIHIEPLPTQVLVRFRVDGVLRDKTSFQRETFSSLVTRVKILSDLKLDEQRRPQDGTFPFQTQSGEKISIRVSIVPTVYGEKIVLRILKDTLTKFDLEELGLLIEDKKAVERILERTHGMFLVTGPTGSGKTTTLYTLLGLINNPGVNIVTIEDPVENRVRRANQIQVNATVGLSFAQGLRSILRQDPDIIMVGEIRDTETANIAVNSALTGHLVFSSVHANNAAGAVPRMLDLGVEPFLLASTLNMVVAQRLVRILCPKCKVKIPLDQIIKDKLKTAGKYLAKEMEEKIDFNYQAKGCHFCQNSGFRGRTGIFEEIVIDEDIKNLIIEKPTESKIWSMAREKGAKTMLEDGLIKVSLGITTIEEVFRVISE